MMKNKIFKTLIVWILYLLWLFIFSGTDLTLINVLSYIAFLGVNIFIYRDDLKDGLKKLKKDKKKIRTFILYFIIIFAILIVSNILIGVISNGAFDSDSSSKSIYSLFEIVPFGTMFVMFITIFFYPIVEELVFRKSLYDVISNPILFIILSSLITWYFQVTLINPQISEFILALSTLFNSVFASIVLTKKKNIWYAIIPRMAYNLVICLVQLIPLITK